jgi:hypothetical protein
VADRALPIGRWLAGSQRRAGFAATVQVSRHRRECFQIDDMDAIPIKSHVEKFLPATGNPIEIVWENFLLGR